jgi:hypothetical protein
MPAAPSPSPVHVPRLQGTQLIANSEALFNSEEGTAATTAETACKRLSSAIGQPDVLTNPFGNCAGNSLVAVEGHRDMPRKKRKKQKKQCGDRKSRTRKKMKQN